MQDVETGMYIQRYRNTDAERWDDFVDRSVNGTVMNTRRFLSYHPPARFRDHSLWLTDDGDRLLAVFPAAEVDAPDGKWLQSHPGATYGGVVVPPNVYGQSIYTAFSLLIRYATEHGFVGIRMRLPEPIFLRWPIGEIDAALFEYGFELEARELSSAVSLAGFSPDSMPRHVRQELRSSVNKSLREGVIARQTDDFASYWPILEENLRNRHQTRPTHTLEEIVRLKDLLGDRIELVACYKDDQMIAGVVSFRMNSHAAHTFYFAQDFRFKQHRPLTLAIYQTMESCVRKGIQFLNFGVSTLPGSYGHDLNWGLFGFKRDCGGQGVVRDTWIRRLGGR